MFVRRKKNRSGTISIVVVDKHGGKFKELHTIGIAADESEIDGLGEKGREWIKEHPAQPCCGTPVPADEQNGYCGVPKEPF